MRCPDCNKFVGVDPDTDPEVNLDISSDGEVSGDVRIENNCAECGTLLRSATLDASVSPDDIKTENGMSLAAWLDALTPEARAAVELEYSESGTERTSRSEGKGRGTRTFYGARVEFEVIARIEADDTTEPKTIAREESFSGEWSDDVQASSMDEEC